MLDTPKPLAPYIVCAIILCILPMTWLTQYSWVVPIVSALILVFGLPHGAYDIFLLRAQVGPGKTLHAACLYLVIALCMPLIWWISPTFFLVTFLVLSIVHFGDSDWPDESWLAKLGWGTLVLAIPATTQPDDVRELFATFSPTPLAGLIVQFLTVLLIPAGFSLFVQRKTFGIKLMALLLLAALCLRTSALIGFAGYFCLLHSRSHLIRWRSRLPIRDTRLAGVMVCLVLTATMTVYFSHGAYHAFMALDARAVAITFIVLASLTVPHMIVVALANQSLPLSTSRQQATNAIRYQANSSDN